MVIALFSREKFDLCKNIYQQYMINKIKYIWTIGKIYIIWILLYFFSSQLYLYFCVPFSFIGFLTSPILVTAPYCIALRWCMVNGADVITSMWLVLGSWLVSMLVTTAN